MNIYINKCSSPALHRGRHNTENKHILNGVHIDKSNSEKRLKIISESRPEAQRAVNKYN